MSFHNNIGIISSIGPNNSKGLCNNPKHSNNGAKTDRTMKRHRQIYSYT